VLSAPLPTIAGVAAVAAADVVVVVTWVVGAVVTGAVPCAAISDGPFPRSRCCIASSKGCNIGGDGVVVGTVKRTPVGVGVVVG